MLILSPAHLPELENHACKHEAAGFSTFASGRIHDCQTYEEAFGIGGASSLA